MITRLRFLEQEVLGVVPKLAYVADTSQPADFGRENALEYGRNVSVPPLAHEPEALPVHTRHFLLDFIAEAVFFLPVAEGCAAMTLPYCLIVGYLAELLANQL
jgi:hypothetical protein